MLSSAVRNKQTRQEVHEPDADIGSAYDEVFNRGMTQGSLAALSIAKHSPQAGTLRQVRRQYKNAKVNPDGESGTKGESSEVRLNADLNVKSTFVRKEKMMGDGSAEIVGEEQTHIVLAAKRFFNKARLFGVKDPERHGSYIPMEPWIVHPMSSFATFWNLAMVLFILCCMLLIPFKMAFAYETHMKGSYVQAFWAVTERTMDVYFLIDVRQTNRLHCHLYTSRLYTSRLNTTYAYNRLPVTDDLCMS
jgi:hypothetical protein